ncbi:FtsX-like permease family protein [Streptomyces sp. F63]|uniref:FtsX-like permease family protein n=1 Tax=Streptomyces sp. F63 TaxID=2824887 RepID=UPI001FFDD5DB|nr:FtsX-like permease family protein [Streptomyces sp. F63]
MTSTDTDTGIRAERETAAPPPPATDSRSAPARWAADLLMGVRFAFTGGREGWVRAVLTAVGVGLGAALLLAAASVPEVMANRDARGTERSASNFGQEVAPGPGTVEVGQANTEYRGDGINGLLVRADGDEPPVPPGLSALPAPGEMAVSPALRELLDSPDGELLRERLDYRITETIGRAGLVGPSELIYYAGATEEDFASGHTYHLDRFGYSPIESEPLPAELLLLVIIICVVLLLPVMIFIGTAVRFGGERRDRRLAALRLVGADGRMVRRIAAGEAMAGALLGLAVGGVLFLLVRASIESVVLFDISTFSSDLRPSPLLAALIVLAVPASAVVVTLLVLRGVVIEPLGVVRSAVPRRRRLWWRLLLPGLGLALLLPMVGGWTGDGPGSGDGETYQVAGGTVLVLTGVAGLLPWLVESVVNRLSGGSVPWQLAVRRLQLSSGTAARAVSGITVAVAGAIAIQMLFASAEAQNTEETGQDPGRAQMYVSVSAREGGLVREFTERFRATEGVTGVVGYVQEHVTEPKSAVGKGEEPGFTRLTVADCAALRELVAIGGRCEDGDTFVTPVGGAYEQFAGPGTTLDLRTGEDGGPTDDPVLWTVPETARTVPLRETVIGGPQFGVFATPAALDAGRLQAPDVVAELRLDPREPDAADHVRNTAAGLAPLADAYTLHSTQQGERFTAISRALFAGATATLLLIGASMVVSTLEQLRERRRLLSVLVAFGTRRRTLAWSVLWQTAVPVALGLALAAAGGVGLGAVLLKMVNTPVSVDWASLGLMTGVGAGLVLLVTLLSLPPLWRMMRPDGLRTE